MKLKFLIGCYTDVDHKYGIHLLEVDPESAEFTTVNSHEIENASYLLESPKREVLYAVNENHTTADGVTAIAFDKDSGSFENLGNISIKGSDPCYITTDVNANHLFTANYSDGSLSVVTLTKDGKLDQTVQIITHKVDLTTDPDAKTHVHATVFSPDGKFLLVSNLGLDTITIYRYQAENVKKPLDENIHQVYQFPSGTGPRHIIFDKQGVYVYVVGELDGSVQVLKWENEILTGVQNLMLMPAEFTGKNSAAEIRLHPNGRFLFVSNRGDANQIVSFSVDTSTGKLSFLERTPTNGNGPRNFAIDLTGNYMIVAHQHSGDIRLFKINAVGKLLDSGLKHELFSPVFVFFI